MSIHPQTGHTHSAKALMTHSTHAFWEKAFFLRLTCRHLAFIILWQCWKKTVVFHTKTPTTHPPFFPLFHFTLFSYGSLRSSLLMLIVNSKVKKQLALKEDTIGIGREGEAAKRQRQCQRAGRYDATVMTFCAFTIRSQQHTHYWLHITFPFCRI